MNMLMTVSENEQAIVHKSRVRERHVCPACSATQTVDFFTGDAFPVNVGVFYDDGASALNAPLAPITLSYCRQCGFVHNRKFDSSSQIFEPGYEVALHHSETFRRFIKGVANRLIERFNLKGKRIVEIGCGDAYFLKNLASLGANRCTGIDPTIVQEGSQRAGEGSLDLIRAYFGTQHETLEADFICSLSVLEDIPRISEFLASVHALARPLGAPVYFEVFNAWRAFEKKEVWSVHYEQCNYFSLESLKEIFLQHGFQVHRADTCYEEDQYLFVEATPRDAMKPLPKAEVSSARLPRQLQSFGEEFKKRRSLWQRRMEEYRSQGKRVVVWGTGGKGITFLNCVPGTELIEFVVEINPNKQGKYVPGTGQRIVAPEFLTDYQPDKVIITNPLYENEMKKQAQALGVDTEFLVA